MKRERKIAAALHTPRLVAASHVLFRKT